MCNCNVEGGCRIKPVHTSTLMKNHTIFSINSFSSEWWPSLVTKGITRDKEQNCCMHHSVLSGTIFTVFSILCMVGFSTDVSNLCDGYCWSASQCLLVPCFSFLGLVQSIRSYGKSNWEAWVIILLVLEDLTLMMMRWIQTMPEWTTSERFIPQPASTDPHHQQWEKPLFICGILPQHQWRGSTWKDCMQK